MNKSKQKPCHTTAIQICFQINLPVAGDVIFNKEAELLCPYLHNPLMYSKGWWQDFVVIIGVI